MVKPDTLNDDVHVVLFNVVNPDTFNDDNTVALLDVKLYEVMSYTPELFIILFILYWFEINEYSELIYIMVQIYFPNVVGKHILIDVKILKVID